MDNKHSVIYLNSIFNIQKVSNNPQQFVKGDMNEMSKTSSTRKRMSVRR